MTQPVRWRDIPAEWPREKKIEALLGIADMLRFRWKQKNNTVIMEPDDLWSYVAMAIVRAVDEFDPVRNTKLTTYAMSRARWAYLEAMRQYGLATREMARRGEGVQWVPFSSLRDNLEEYLQHKEERQDSTLEAVSVLLERERLYRYIHKLPERQRAILLQYLTGEFTQQEIAAEQHITQSRLSQILSEVRERLKTMARQDEMG